MRKRLIHLVATGLIVCMVAAPVCGYAGSSASEGEFDIATGSNADRETGGSSFKATLSNAENTTDSNAPIATASNALLRGGTVPTATFTLKVTGDEWYAGDQYISEWRESGWYGGKWYESGFYLSNGGLSRDIPITVEGNWIAEEDYDIGAIELTVTGITGIGQEAFNHDNLYPVSGEIQQFLYFNGVSLDDSELWELKDGGNNGDVCVFANKRSIIAGEFNDFMFTLDYEAVSPGFMRPFELPLEAVATFNREAISECEEGKFIFGELPGKLIYYEQSWGLHLTRYHSGASLEYLHYEESEDLFDSFGYSWSDFDLSTSWENFVLSYEISRTEMKETSIKEIDGKSYYFIRWRPVISYLEDDDVLRFRLYPMSHKLEFRTKHFIANKDGTVMEPEVLFYKDAECTELITENSLCKEPVGLATEFFVYMCVEVPDVNSIDTIFMHCMPDIYTRHSDASDLRLVDDFSGRYLCKIIDDTSESSGTDETNPPMPTEPEETENPESEMKESDNTDLAATRSNASSSSSRSSSGSSSRSSDHTPVSETIPVVEAELDHAVEDGTPAVEITSLPKTGDRADYLYLVAILVMSGTMLIGLGYCTFLKSR